MIQVPNGNPMMVGKIAPKHCIIDLRTQVYKGSTPWQAHRTVAELEFII
jgi:hypothetical protein